MEFSTNWDVNIITAGDSVSMNLLKIAILSSTGIEKNCGLIIVGSRTTQLTEFLRMKSLNDESSEDINNLESSCRKALKTSLDFTETVFSISRSDSRLSKAFFSCEF
jgi:hypothetical protein